MICCAVGPRHLHLAVHQRGELLALEELHHKEDGAVLGPPEIGNVDDVLVVDRGGRLGLLQEPVDVCFVAAELLPSTLTATRRLSVTCSAA